LNQLIQFYSNNATNLHHLTTHSTTCWRCWPTKWRSHCDHRYVTSLHPMYCSVVTVKSILLHNIMILLFVNTNLSKFYIFFWHI